MDVERALSPSHQRLRPGDLRRGCKPLSAKYSLLFPMVNQRFQWTASGRDGTASAAAFPTLASVDAVCRGLYF
jgi:hypothetical protein